MTDTYFEVTTSHGRKYTIDLERGFWSRGPNHYTHRLWELKAGTSLSWPWDDPKSWEDRMPVVGEHLFVRGKDEWYTSTEIVSIEEKQWEDPRNAKDADAEVEV